MDAATGAGVDIDGATLVVVDVQNGFVNDHSRHVVPVISGFASRWSAAGRPVVFTRYRNYPGSSFERFFRWSRLQSPPETDIVPELTEQAAAAYAVLDKVGYSLFTDEAVALLADAGWTDLVFCGIATESCVLNRGRRLRAGLRTVDPHRRLRQRRRARGPRGRPHGRSPAHRPPPTDHHRWPLGATRREARSPGAGIAA